MKGGEEAERRADEDGDQRLRNANGERCDVPRNRAEKFRRRTLEGQTARGTARGESAKGRPRRGGNVDIWKWAGIP